MIDFMIVLIISIAILYMAYLIGIKKRLDIISFMSKEKLDSKTEKEKNFAASLMGLMYFILWVIYILIQFIPSFGLIGFLLFFIVVLISVIYIYKIF